MSNFGVCVVLLFMVCSFDRVLVTGAPPACRDHAGGNDKIKQLCPGIVVIGAETAPIE